MPRAFHSFESREVMGRGGMSTVYRGVHKVLGYPVAIKILDPGLAADETFIRRFEREARSASSLQDSRIVPVIDFGSEDDCYFIVMKYIEGKNLAQVLAEIGADGGGGGRRALPTEIALALVEEMAYGLKVAHDQNIIHRDIKPSNVMLSSGGDVMLLDFGLARDKGDLARFAARDETRPGTVLGTPAYMSPEQSAGGSRVKVDHRTDIFSLGVVAYELLTGEKPFRGDVPSEIQERILNADPPPVTQEMCPLFNADIQMFLERMLAKDPAKRFATIDHVLTGLKECIEDLDGTGSLYRFRKEYLTRLVANPPGFAAEMRRLSISSHLKLALHYKNMGRSNIGDALRHVRYALALDPGNARARATEAEIEAILEGAGTQDQRTVVMQSERQTPDDGRTIVASAEPNPPSGAARPEAASASPPPPKPAASPTPERRPRSSGDPLAAESGRRVRRMRRRAGIWIAGGIGAVVVIAALGAYLLSPRDKPVPPRIPQAMNTPAATAGRLLVTTVPVAAKVSVRSLGPTAASLSDVTPCTFDNLSEGRWLVGIEKTGYLPDSTRIDLVAGTTQELRFALTRTPPVTSAEGSASLPAAQPHAATAKPEAYPGPQANPPRTPPPYTPQSPTPAAAAFGYARLSIGPFADVYLDGQLSATEAQFVVLRMKTGIPHTIELHHRRSYGRISITGVQVSSSDTLDLGRRDFRWGTLRVDAPFPVHVTIDGVAVEEPAPFTKRIAEGEHLLGVRDASVSVRSARVANGSGEQPLSPAEGGPSTPAFRIRVAEHQDTVIRLDLEKTR